jgi:single-strand DNA-binding protein
MDLNNCTFTGRLTRDAEKKILPTGTELVTFDIAINTGWGDYAKTLYVTINLWGKSGTGAYPYLLKGVCVGVSGEIELQQWISKQDGSTQKKLQLGCNKISLLGSPKDKPQDNIRQTEPQVIEPEVIDEIPY